MPNRLLAIAALSVLAGCAALLPRPEPPTVSLAAVRSLQLGAGVAVVGLRFDAANPNDFELDVASIEFDLSIEGVKVATGRTTQPFTLPRRGSTPIDVDVTTTLDRAVEATRSVLDRRSGLVRYEVAGQVALAAGRTVPFRREGEAPLPALRFPGLPRLQGGR